MLAVDTLEDRCYVILEAGDAQEALELLEQTSNISLIFTNINMPGDIDGLDLAAEVAKRWPQDHFIVTSGAIHLSDDAIPDEGISLPKPYSPADLARLVKAPLISRDKED